jgi:phenylalanyl-tRNA synthetase alpha chain
MDLKSTNLENLRTRFTAGLAQVKDKAALEGLKREWLGKEGILKTGFQQLREIEASEKPKVAAVLNELKAQLEEFLVSKEREFSNAQRLTSLETEFVDPSLPGRSPGFGRVHPITAVERRIYELLKPFGFQIVQGPEVETEYYCFDSLNIPPHHPARDMQDTYYTVTGHVLRTHTTSVQARVLEKGGVPVKIASFGRTYRNETEDASHQAMFHQFELVWIEQGLTLSNLMAIITHILKGLYGKRRKVKFVPKFYPYTEPSLGPQIDCGSCAGAGCSFCGGSGWVTVAGSGMVHRNVLKGFGYDPDQVSGFAFGLGTGRLATQACGLSDARVLYENDLRIYRRLA